MNQEPIDEEGKSHKLLLAQKLKIWVVPGMAAEWMTILEPVVVAGTSGSLLFQRRRGAVSQRRLEWPIWPIPWHHASSSYLWPYSALALASGPARHSVSRSTHGWYSYCDNKNLVLFPRAVYQIGRSQTDLIISTYDLCFYSVWGRNCFDYTRILR